MEVELETARLAKKMGFNVRVHKYFDENGICKIGMDSTGYVEDWDWNNSHLGWCSAPTQSELQCWLRETHNIQMFLKPFYDSLEKKNSYACDTFRISDGRVRKSPRLDKYEDALEYALIEALNLI
jgi:hypothetical protein